MTTFEVPAFATIGSILAAWCRDHKVGTIGNINERIGAPSNHHHYFAWRAQTLSDKIFGGQITADALLDRHSQLPLFTAILPEEVAAEVRESQRVGTDYSYHRLNQYADRDVLESPKFRRRPECVKEDVARYGVAHWRLYHQWPFARHCAEHRVPLQQACKRCRLSPYPCRFVSHLASDPCGYCPGTGGFTNLVDTSPVAGEPHA